MSARLLTVLILPTLLLAVALAPSRAAQQPTTEPVKPLKAVEKGKVTLVTKVYQVTDLVIPLLPCEAAPKDES